jgi:hypothetical protein
VKSRIARARNALRGHDKPADLKVRPTCGDEP